MSKTHVTDLLSEYIEGSLSYGNAEKVRGHLAFCNPCRQALTETEHHIDVLKSTPFARLPAGLETKVLARVHQELKAPGVPLRESSSFWPSWLTPMRGLALAATCGIAIVVVRNVPHDFAERAEAPARKAPTTTELDQKVKADVGSANAPKEEAAADNQPSGEKQPEGFGGSTGGAAVADRDGAAAKDALTDAVSSNKVAPPIAPVAPAPEAVKAPMEREAAKPVEMAVARRAMVAEEKLDASALQKSADKSGRLIPETAAPWAAAQGKSSVIAEKKSVAAPVTPAVPATPEVPQMNRQVMPLVKAKAEIAAAAPAPISPMEGSRSSISRPQEFVISDQAAWEALWKRHNSNIQPLPVLPQIDFATHQVLAIFAGERPSGGFRIQLLEVSKTPWNGNTVRVVRFRVVGPAAGTMAAQVISYPYLLTVQPRFDGQTFFQKRP